MNRIHDNNPMAKRFDYLEQITDDLLQGADDTGSKVGTGGMKSKLLAAKTADISSAFLFLSEPEKVPKNCLNIVRRGRGWHVYFQSRYRKNQ